MDEHTLLTIFVGLAALAMLIQAGTLLGLFIVAKRIQEKVSALTGPVTGLIDTSKRTLQMVEGHVDRIGASSSAILDTTKQQLVKVDELITDASTRAKVQMERAEMVLD